MAKKKELELKELLNKLAPIFPSDLCIVDGKDVIEGNLSYTKTNGHCWCILSAEAMELLGKLYPDCKYIYVKDVKKAKVDPDTYITTDRKKILIDDIEERRHNYLLKYDETNICNPLLIDDTLIENIFNGHDVNITIPEYEKGRVNLSKSLLPTITKKNINDMKYTAVEVDTRDSEENIIAVIFLIDEPLCTLYMYYSYLVC